MLGGPCWLELSFADGVAVGLRGDGLVDGTLLGFCERIKDEDLVGESDEVIEGDCVL